MATIDPKSGVPRPSYALHNGQSDSSMTPRSASCLRVRGVVVNIAARHSDAYRWEHLLSKEAFPFPLTGTRHSWVDAVITRPFEFRACIA